MGIAVTEEHVALEEAVRRFARDRCPAAVARAALDAEAEALPPFWDELAGLGWLGLHLPERVGGSGYGLAEVAVVVEQLGRVVAPGPYLPTVLAAAAIRDGAGPDSSLSAIATGAAATVALMGPPLAAVRTHTTAAADGVGALDVSGVTGPVPCAAIADYAVIPIALDGDERWAVVDLRGATVEALPALDGTRRLGRIHLDSAPAQLLAQLSAARLRALAATLFAAECAGGAAWCVESAAQYAKVRIQFGRPIGQFQGVKHRCADMLVAGEQAAGAAWDAAAALDHGDDPAALLAADIAGAVAPDVFVRVAKDCIQVLGGIGFTWEHDAHVYLRRATSTRQLLQAPHPFRREVALAALAGVRRAPQLELPADAEAVRDEVRAFACSVEGLDRAEQRSRVVDAGYFVPHWSAPWGRGAGAVEQLVIDEEFRRHKIRRPNLAVGAWAAPTIAVHGTDAQQQRWVRPTLLGEVSWCQLFSEPEAGSDLASLRTAATRADGGWLLNGQKVWTSMAREADWGICLARTNPSAPKHLGITYFIVDMRTPGLDVRPLRELTGFAMFNEVFLTDVFVPDDCVIGEIDGGWPLARTTLANERVAMGSGSSFGGGVENLLTLAGGLARHDDPLVLDQLGENVAEAHTVALLGVRATARSLSGAKPGPEASVRKLLGVEHDQRTQELGLALLGVEGATTAGAAEQWTFGFLANRCLTIAGGTSEVQRNVIAERLLGLPRDPEPSP